MAKKIKFNLILDGVAVRDLNSLRDNFNLDDLIAYFRGGVLQRWLDVRGFKSELREVEKIDRDTSGDEVARKLIEIFQISQLLPEDIFHIKFLEERRAFLSQVSQGEFSQKEIIEQYHKRYNLLKESMIENCDNLPFLQSGVREIEREFLPLFQLEAKELLNLYVKNHILIAIAFLLNRGLRSYMLNSKDIKSKLSGIIFLRNEKIREIYNQFKSFKGLDDKLKKRVKIYKGDTAQKWIRVEDGDVLILQSNAGTKIRDIYKPENELSHIYAKGSIIRGLEFQSFKESHFVKYIPLKDIDGFIGSISIFRGVTDGYWKDIEISGRDYLILELGQGCYVRSLGNYGEELSSEDVNEQFPLLNGIDYKSNSVTETLYYVKGSYHS